MKKGIKKLFVGELLVIISLICILSVILVFPGLICALVGLILYIIGLAKCKGVNKFFKIGCICFIVNLPLTVVSGFMSILGIGGAVIAPIISVASSILGLVGNFCIIKGVGEAVPEVKNLAKTVMIVYLITLGLSVVTEALEIFVALPKFVGVASTIAEVVGCLMLIILLGKAAKKATA